MTVQTPGIGNVNLLTPGDPCEEQWANVGCTTRSAQYSGEEIDNNQQPYKHTDVTSLTMTDSGLNGHLPTELGYLSRFTSNFKLDQNALSGTVPSELVSERHAATRSDTE